jgi:NAD(P)-dependent dehydrogenase (short-subunit alcohol dehydrogenase family)
MKTIVMTGGTSGLGAVALSHMTQERDVRVLLGARGTPPANIQTLPLDLARLDSSPRRWSTGWAALRSTRSC